MDAVIKIDNLKAILKKKDISIYKLSQLTGIGQTAMYDVMHEERHLRPSEAKTIADVLETPVRDLFPELLVEEPSLVDMRDQIQDGKLKPYNVGDVKVEKKAGEEMGKREHKLTLNDMMVGSQTMLPEDGVTLFIRKVVNYEGAEFIGYTLSPDEMIIIKTGVSTKGLDLNKILIKMKPDRVMKNEMFGYVFPQVKDNELCVVVYGYGSPVLLSQGQPFAEIVFI